MVVVSLRPMKRILIVTATTGYQTRAFAEAAATLGMTAILATDRCHVLDDPWGDGAIAVRFDEPSAASEAIAAAGPFDGIIALGDRPTLVASLAAARLGIPYNDPSSVEAARNKFLSRRRLAIAGLPVPEFFRLPLDSDPAAAAPGIRDGPTGPPRSCRGRFRAPQPAGAR